MSLSSTVNEYHVKEAHRLFQVSTLATAKAGYNLNGEIPSELIPLVRKIEDGIKRRVPIHSKISYEKLLSDMQSQFSNDRAINYAILNLMRSDFKYIEGKKIIIREK